MPGRDVTLFDRFGPVYEVLMPSAKRPPLARGLSRAERPIERVLDVAGGTGRAVRAVDAEERVVVDAARGMLEQVPRRGHADGGGRDDGRIEAVQGDATRLPLADDCADAAIVADALHHLPDHDAVLAECARVLRPGGVLVVREFDPTTLRGRALVAAEHLVGFDSVFHAPDVLARLMADAGFAARVTDDGFGYTVAGVVPGE